MWVLMLRMWGLRAGLVCLLGCAVQVIQGAQAKGLWCVS